MAIDFTGTNTEETDKLIAAVVELRTTVRLFLFAVGLGLPLVVGLQVSVVVESFRTTAKLDQLAEQQAATRTEVQTVRAEVVRLTEQQAATRAEVDRLAKEQAATRAEVQTLGGRIERLEQRVGKP
jgi:outer membrane murein-binding lipoprotein Lpp